jgi:uncharacterized protein (TIGR00297 family)
MRPVPRFSEDARQLVHIAMGGAALLLRFTSWWQAAVIAGGAVAFNAYALPHVARGWLYRELEGRRRFLSGITLYPIAILCLILALPDRFDIVASAWGVLAFGDGMATLVGRHVAGPRIPWNDQKSVAGTAAFILFGGAAGAFLCWWCSPVIVPPPYRWFSMAAPWLAAIAAALVETIPIRLNDNISVPATAAAVLWWASLISEDPLPEVLAAAWGLLPLAIVANAALAVAGYLARALTASGAICGAGIGIVVVLTAGWGGWALLLATFAMAVITSRVGFRHKTRLGIAEVRGGRRGAANAFANTAFATAAAVLAAVSYARDPALIGFVAGLAAAGSDTMASEIGKAWGHRTFLFPAFRPVPAGTSGAVSLAGTIAGAIGAAVLGLIGVAAGLIPWSALLPVIAGATIGAFTESALGAQFEEPGIVNNDVLNFLNTAIAGASAVLIAKSLA